MTHRLSALYRGAGRDRKEGRGWCRERLFRQAGLHRAYALRTAVRNTGGGHVNHQFFWDILEPRADGAPKGAIADAIKRDFGSFEHFQSLFTDAATKHVGSGWAFLVVNPSRHRLEIVTLPNQDSVLMHGTPGLLCCDVWEHAYYLKYRNRRPDYLSAWWKVVAWDVVDERLHDVITETSPFSHRVIATSSNGLAHGLQDQRERGHQRAVLRQVRQQHRMIVLGVQPLLEVGFTEHTAGLGRIAGCVLMGGRVLLDRALLRNAGYSTR